MYIVVWKSSVDQVTISKWMCESECAHGSMVPHAFVVYVLFVCVNVANQRWINISRSNNWSLIIEIEFVWIILNLLKSWNIDASSVWLFFGTYEYTCRMFNVLCISKAYLSSSDILIVQENVEQNKFIRVGCNGSESAFNSTLLLWASFGLCVFLCWCIYVFIFFLQIQ